MWFQQPECILYWSQFRLECGPRPPPEVVVERSDLYLSRMRFGGAFTPSLSGSDSYPNQKKTHEVTRCKRPQNGCDACGDSVHVYLGPVSIRPFKLEL